MTQVREDFTAPAPEETIQRVAERMRERNIEVVVVDDGDHARKVVLERLPAGAEVHSGKSKTLQDAGIFDAIHDASRYDALRPRIFKMDRQTVVGVVAAFEEWLGLDHGARWERYARQVDRLGAMLDGGSRSIRERNSSSRKRCATARRS